MASTHCNQREHDPASHCASDLLRRVVLQQGFVAKPTAYAPSGKTDEHPLMDAHAQLQARLQALRDVRQKLRFAPSSDRSRSSRSGWRSRESSSSSSTSSSNNNSEDVDMADTSPSLARFPRDSMEISTRVAVSAQSATNDDWIHEGGIVALGGLEMLFFGFLTPQELVRVGAVCQSWYALARRDVLWEPLLVTPVEKYPLRSFLGFNSTPLPALQVYIIYRKIRTQLQSLDSKTDETPRQSADALRFEELFLRYHRGLHHHNGNGNGGGGHHHDHDVLDELVQLRRLGPDGVAALMAQARTLGKLRLESVHLVYPAEEPPTEQDYGDAVGHHARRPLFPQREPQFAQRVDAAGLQWDQIFAGDGAAEENHERIEDAMMAAFDDNDSDEEIWDDRNDDGHGGGDNNNNHDDVAMVAPPPPPPQPLAHVPVRMPVAVENQQQQRRGSLSKIIVDGCRRVRLQTWLNTNGRMSRAVFQSFARQLLVALTTLELSQHTHSDVGIGNILVLDHGASPVVMPHANANANTEATATTTASPASNQTTSDDASDTTSHTYAPLFQLYCRSAVNIWPTQQAQYLQQQRPPPPPPPLLPPQTPPVAMMAQRARHRRFAAFAAFGGDLGGGHDVDEPPALLRRLLAARPANRFGAAAVFPANAALTPPTAASLVTMVRSYTRILREVWCHGRVVAQQDRSLPLLSLIYRRPQLIGSVTLRSFLEYAEFLVSSGTEIATPSRLLEHVYMQPSSSSSSSSAFLEEEEENALLAADNTTRFVVGRSNVRPTLCGSADDYRAQVFAWHARHLHTSRHGGMVTSASIVHASSSSLASPTPPTTLLGPAFFHDALSESRLPHQRFRSVVAPKTASSTWVHTLAVSQRSTLEQLDLSHAQLPLSVLLRELYHLQKLTHLRLPREILRDENLEQFVAAVWCVGLLPSLAVMDESVKTALDRMEFAYTTQLQIMTSLLDRSNSNHNTQHQPQPQHQQQQGAKTHPLRHPF